jgi:hypothetical protein
VQLGSSATVTLAMQVAPGDASDTGYTGETGYTREAGGAQVLTTSRVRLSWTGLSLVVFIHHGARRPSGPCHQRHAWCIRVLPDAGSGPPPEQSVHNPNLPEHSIGYLVDICLPCRGLSVLDVIEQAPVGPWPVGTIPEPHLRLACIACGFSRHAMRNAHRQIRAGMHQSLGLALLVRQHRLEQIGTVVLREDTPPTVVRRVPRERLS